MPRNEEIVLESYYSRGLVRVHMAITASTRRNITNQSNSRGMQNNPGQPDPAQEVANQERRDRDRDRPIRACTIIGSA
jgi:hypothetical protein